MDLMHTHNHIMPVLALQLDPNVGHDSRYLGWTLSFSCKICHSIPGKCQVICRGTSVMAINLNSHYNIYSLVYTIHDKLQ